MRNDEQNQEIPTKGLLSETTIAEVYVPCIYTSNAHYIDLNDANDNVVEVEIVKRYYGDNLFSLKVDGDDVLVNTLYIMMVSDLSAFGYRKMFLSSQAVINELAALCALRLDFNNLGSRAYVRCSSWDYKARRRKELGDG